MQFAAILLMTMCTSAQSYRLDFKVVANVTTSEPLKRFDNDIPGTHGSGLFAVDGNSEFVTMLDGDGAATDFYVPGPMWLRTGGKVFIKHNALAIDPAISSNPPGTFGPLNDQYPIYANCRVYIVGPAATKAALPALNWVTPPSAPLVTLEGWNIASPVDHYASISLAGKYRLPGAGYYRTEVWCGTGSSADPSRDGLGSLVPYNSHLTIQFWGEVY